MLYLFLCLLLLYCAAMCGTCMALAALCAALLAADVREQPVAGAQLLSSHWPAEQPLWLLSGLAQRLISKKKKKKKKKEK